MRLNGKTALVTGAASGFGLQIATRFAAEGAKVACVDINADGAKAIADQIGGLALTCDVTDGGQVRDCVERAVGDFGQLDIVINNAGWSHPNGPLLDVDYDAFRKVYAINVDSIFHMTHAVVPHWRDIGGGVMLNVGSTAGIRPRPGLTWYNSTKGAVHLMTKSLAVDLAPDKIRVCALAPVVSATALLETFLGGPDTPEARERFVSTIPLGRMCEPTDMASAAVFLASDEANFLTGVILEIDGGRTI
ncbi:SDR family oxidoreductase [Actibacterium sp. 188UL27-1]|uniref:SDR family oxidoreductase n=1 Tax=Actibacterium sp. 188UL27-1 TaxID=2786961 RepID=UPI00195EE5FD|nr:SDR family oxidoreductase [Actibacterium sp. 188UL27-1]MBM7066156.1 SDR family oxidoreductase [Actibacterium sp. 188UL27-1]